MVNGLNGLVDQGVARLSVLPQLQLLEGGEDEGDGRHEDHQQGEVSHELGTRWLLWDILIINLRTNWRPTLRWLISAGSAAAS